MKEYVIKLGCQLRLAQGLIYRIWPELGIQPFQPLGRTSQEFVWIRSTQIPSGQKGSAMPSVDAVAGVVAYSARGEGTRTGVFERENALRNRRPLFRLSVQLRNRN
jgi:hypothetical protein